MKRRILKAVYERRLPQHHLDTVSDMQGVPITECQPLPPSALLTHIRQVEAANSKTLCLLYDRLFYTPIPMTVRGDTVCRRTTRVVRQKMGHRHKHQRDPPFVSPSKYTEFSFVWLNTDTQKERERERERNLNSM